MKLSNIPLIYGVKNVIKFLRKKPFDKLKRIPSKKPVNIKIGIRVTQALMKEDVNSERIIGLRKIHLLFFILLNYLNN